MIIDSSALVAISLQEPGWRIALEILEREPSISMGSPTLLETAMLLDTRLGRDAEGLVDRMQNELELVEVPFGERHWREAASAFWRYGRGRHRANLDLGDCMSYAVARLAHEPLLYLEERNGGGFGVTDFNGRG